MHAPTLETPRLRLRRWTDADLDGWAEMNADPRVMEFFVSTSSRQESNEIAARLRERLDTNGYGWWVLERRDAPGFGGAIALQDVPFEAAFTPAREIGWRLPVHMWGHGFASEAASAALEHAFHALQWPEVVAMTSRLNHRSMRVMERIGMTRDANGDFDNPRVPEGHRIRPHVLYRVRNARSVS